MVKRLLASVLAFVVILTAALNVPFTVSAESLYVRKIVSVVYDDSGSMVGDKWAYANYAMQAFCGMLNSEDQLYISYMRHYIGKDDMDEKDLPEPEKVDLSAKGIQKSVNTIRDDVEVGKNTPYLAVKAAYNKLKSVKDSNPNTQYWLVVITDGEFETGLLESGENPSAENAKKALNKNFQEYVKNEMPNGTKPQVTFLAIGDEVQYPDQDEANGIYTYTASDAEKITEAMSDMADRVSGRTRILEKDLKQIDDKTIQVTSSVPLLNIAVFAQESEAKIVKAVRGSEEEIPICREVALGYPKYEDLVGGAYLLGDSQKVIKSGDYEITFDKKVDLEDVEVLFEPALEMRMLIAVNGKEITDTAELKNVAEGDKLTVSCKIYEMGTDNEIATSQLPPNTKFEITISEDGKVVAESSEKEMSISDYEVKSAETELRATVRIEGFNPITRSETFEPIPPVPTPVYTVEAELKDDIKSIKYEEVASNKDLAVCFTVYEDGTAVTDPEKVKALKPTISVSPSGNEGVTTYSDDGKIIFTPNKVAIADAAAKSFNVEVTCTLEDGTSAQSSYTVTTADFAIVPLETTESIKKTEFFGNKIGTSFYITKDGVQMQKSEVEQDIEAKFNAEYAELKSGITVDADGTITVTPYTDEEHKLTFWSWWVNWWYYFSLPDEDVTVRLVHPLGTADSSIKVVEETIQYRLLNVYAPLLIELAVLAFIITWIILIVTKPRYLKNTALYVATIRYNKSEGTHTVRNMSVKALAPFNKFKYIWRFKKTAEIVSASGIQIRADHGDRIICEERQPWYRGTLVPADAFEVTLRTPADVKEYIRKNKRLEIEEFATTETIDGDDRRALTPQNPNRAKYIVIPDSGTGVSVVDGRRVINSGKIFIYTYQ